MSARGRDGGRTCAPECFDGANARGRATLDVPAGVWALSRAATKCRNCFVVYTIFGCGGSGGVEVSDGALRAFAGGHPVGCSLRITSVSFEPWV